MIEHKSNSLLAVLVEQVEANDSARGRVFNLKFD